MTILKPSYRSAEEPYEGVIDSLEKEEEEEEGEEIRLNVGDELALVCQGTGDPEPRIKWTRKVGWCRLIMSEQKEKNLGN